MNALLIAILALAQVGTTPATAEVSDAQPADGTCDWLWGDTLRVTVPARRVGDFEAMLSDAVTRGWVRLAGCMRKRAKHESVSAPEYGCKPGHEPFLIAVMHGRLISYHLDAARGNGEVTLQLPAASAHWKANCHAQ